MKLKGELSILFLQVTIRGISGNSENFVEVLATEDPESI